MFDDTIYNKLCIIIGDIDIAKPGNRQYCSAMPTKVPLPPISEWSHLSSDLQSKYAPKLPATFYASFKTHVEEPNSQVKFDGSKSTDAAGGKWKIFS